MPTVLIVDDDAAIRESVQMALEDESYTIINMTTPAAMLQVLQTAAEPLLVLLDVSIQQHGQRLIDHVLADPTLVHKHGYILFTAARHDTIPRAAAAAGWPVLNKPFDLPDLFLALEHAATQIPTPRP